VADLSVPAKAGTEEGAILNQQGMIPKNGYRLSE